jgi:hypothetical protein
MVCFWPTPAIWQAVLLRYSQLATHERRSIDARSANLKARTPHSGKAKSNSHLSRAQFAPNMARNCGRSRLIMVSPFLCMQGNCLASASRFSSSKLAMRVRFSSPAPWRKPQSELPSTHLPLIPYPPKESPRPWRSKGQRMSDDHSPRLRAGRRHAMGLPTVAETRLLTW